MWVVVSTRLENATFDLNLAWYDRHRKLQHKKFKNVEAPIIKKPFGDGLYHPFMVILGMVYHMVQFLAGYLKVSSVVQGSALEQQKRR